MGEKKRKAHLNSHDKFRGYREIPTTLAQMNCLERERERWTDWLHHVFICRGFGTIYCTHIMQKATCTYSFGIN